MKDWLRLTERVRYALESPRMGRKTVARPASRSGLETDMPRYFFHVEDGSFTRDREGVELPDESAARVEGVRRAGEYLTVRPQEFWESRRWRILIAREGGPALMGLELLPVAGRDLVSWQRE